MSSTSHIDFARREIFTATKPRFRRVPEAERSGRNLSTCEAIAIPAAKRVRFAAGKAFKDAVGTARTGSFSRIAGSVRSKA
ncbi:hypothetical protein GCT13_37990 [Paraburkholderia sp. CNPSo 3157]|uniref:Uncharacterized protein n=1 Tax=Paraburkholderia franconis TaxID=2654983 RepID=A0A7X1NJ27_9BURK|nr:hypothetical protein [Paraburkholderia franconis]